MRQEEGSDNEEEADMLMALAEQAGPTPKSLTQRSSQQVTAHAACVVQPHDGLSVTQCVCPISHDHVFAHKKDTSMHNTEELHAHVCVYACMSARECVHAVLYQKRFYAY